MFHHSCAPHRVVRSEIAAWPQTRPGTEPHLGERGSERRTWRLLYTRTQGESSEGVFKETGSPANYMGVFRMLIAHISVLCKLERAYTPLVRTPLSEPVAFNLGLLLTPYGSTPVQYSSVPLQTWSDSPLTPELDISSSPQVINSG